MECPFCKVMNRYCGSCDNSTIGRVSLPLVSGNANNSTDLSSLPSSYRHLEVGARLQGGRYVVQQILGQGGMGAALLATDLRLGGKAVVIKELVSDSMDQMKVREDVRNFKREVTTLAHIDHPLVPNVTDHFQEGKCYFMVQKYVDGENLERYLECAKQPLKEHEVLVYASEILDVLDYLSQQAPPIVHRDIKPANIVIGSRDKHAHLVDFGIARADVIRNAQRKQTSALGTPGYAPPEQYQGNADSRSDLYALAATLHHLLTNRDPRNHSPFNYPLVRTLNPLLSPEIEQVLVRALGNDASQRYQSASAMKQDVDKILRQRFGVSGNISDYTLPQWPNESTWVQSARPPQDGLGFQRTVADTAEDSGALSVASMPPTYVNVLPVTPVPVPVPVTLPLSQPPSTSELSNGLADNAQLATLSLRALKRIPWPQQARWRIGLSVLIIVLLLLLGGVGYATFLGSSPSAIGIGVTEMGNEAIGISDGTFAFDTTLADGSLKSQAAQMLKQDHNNVNTVISLLNQAIAKNSNDAEALIYDEDLRVVNSGSPYVTVVVATMLTGGSSVIPVGRSDLQGAYMVQKEFNDGAKLHGGIQVRLLIANAGSQSSYVTRVAQQIVQLAHADPTFVGVMGWPFSSYTIAAINILAPAHIPLISQTASSDALTNASPYFFRVVPSNKQQGIQGAGYAIKTLHTKNVALFYDPQDPYSQNLAQDFRQEFQKDGGQVAAEEQYTVGKPETLASQLQAALKKNPDLIYFSGYAGDVSTLLANPLPANLPVLGGDALYELGGYSSTARATSFSHLRFTAFAYPDEWDILGYSSQRPAFFSEYPEDFDPNGQHAQGIYGFTRADNDVTLSYDAVVALLSGCNIALSGGQSVTPERLQQALRKLNGNNTVQGVSGQIAFGPDGTPINKAIVLLSVNAQGYIQMDPQILGQFMSQ